MTQGFAKGETCHLTKHEYPSCWEALCHVLVKISYSGNKNAYVNFKCSEVLKVITDSYKTTAWIIIYYFIDEVYYDL